MCCGCRRINDQWQESQTRGAKKKSFCATLWRIITPLMCFFPLFLCSLLMTNLKSIFSPPLSLIAAPCMTIFLALHFDSDFYRWWNCGLKNLTSCWYLGKGYQGLHIRSPDCDHNWGWHALLELDLYLSIKQSLFQADDFASRLWIQILRPVCLKMSENVFSNFLTSQVKLGAISKLQS